MPHIGDEGTAIAIDPLATGVDFRQWVTPANPFSVGELLSRVEEPPYSVVAPEIFPTVRVGPQGTAQEVAGDGETARPTNVPDPDYLPQETVFESAPGGIYERANPVPTDWDAVYEAYVELNQPKSGEIVINWNEVGASIFSALDPFGVNQAAATAMGFAAPPGATAAPAQQMVVNPVTGQVTRKPCRRRRRRLLTDGDFNDLMRISTLPNKDIVKIALAKAVGR